ncbi:ABC transporter permease [Caloranaerobacter ferrireducens]|uniref:ABC transporter permease n=1 Tax=Caloranaerobacter ferrireducens TaxID=1323370 RepID=UPI00084D21A2|nr:ABC transporter permease [Caloranaerobacter ferrireducens]
MFKRYLGLLKKDIITGFRNFYFLIVIVTALIYVGVINFLIPSEISIKPAVYYHIEYKGDIKNVLQDMMTQAGDEHDSVYAVKSREEVIAKMKKNKNSIGMIVKEIEGKPGIEFIMQGYENKEVINSLILAIEDNINKKISGDVKIETLVLRKGTNIEKIPINKNALPVFILSEPVLLGFFLVVALIFMEKEEGTIRAYVVSPGTLYEYLASKITLMLILGLISTIMSTVLVVGFKVDFLNLIILVTLGSIFGTSLGLILASFFKNISQAMIWIIILMLFITLPFISYFMPSFAPTYIKILPTYPLLFAIRETIFPTGNTQIIYSTMLYYVFLGAITYFLSVFAYKRSLIKE